MAAFARDWKARRQREEQTTGRGTFVPLAFEAGEAFLFDWSGDWAVRGGERTKLQVAYFILDELAHLPFCPSGGALLFHLLRKLYERTSVVIRTNLTFSEWAGVLGHAKMTTALRDRLTHHCHILDPGIDSFRFKANSATAKPRGRKLCFYPLRHRTIIPLSGSILGKIYSRLYCCG